MYEGMREKIRAATKVELREEYWPGTHQHVYTISRQGVVLHRSFYADVVMLQPPPYYIQQEQQYIAERNIDMILDGVDWDYFYPTYTEPIEDWIKRELLKRWEAAYLEALEGFMKGVE